jgi:hypothetical protein
MLSPYRDLTAAKHFLQLALRQTGQIRPRVINVDGRPAYARAISDLRDSDELSSRCRCRPSPYLNNILEQDHRFIKKRIAASLWFRSVDGALKTIAGYESMKYDPQRTGSVASKRRHCRTDELYSAALWHRCMIQTEFTDFVRSGAAVCDTSHQTAAQLEVGHASQRNEKGLTPADVLRQRICRRKAQETGRPYEELIRESVAESRAFFESYTGDRSLAGILRSRYQRRAVIDRTPG